MEATLRVDISSFIQEQLDNLLIASERGDIESITVLAALW
jgi:hypothetical protein